jgi:uncharacterized protein (DUF362 family)
MSGTCEVIGWLLDENGARRVVRDESGATSFEKICADEGIESVAIQTGTFRRGKPIIDPITQQRVGYELESITPYFAHR